ncbi:hypothetical protein OTU49_007336, partial [Cherax quadricarinatus]
GEKLQRNINYPIDYNHDRSKTCNDDKSGRISVFSRLGNREALNQNEANYPVDVPAAAQSDKHVKILYKSNNINLHTPGLLNTEAKNKSNGSFREKDATGELQEAGSLDMKGSTDTSDAARVKNSLSTDSHTVPEEQKEAWKKDKTCNFTENENSSALQEDEMLTKSLFGQRMAAKFKNMKKSQTVSNVNLVSRQSLAENSGTDSRSLLKLTDNKVNDNLVICSMHSLTQKGDKESEVNNVECVKPVVHEGVHIVQKKLEIKRNPSDNPKNLRDISSFSDSERTRSVCHEYKSQNKSCHTQLKEKGKSRAGKKCELHLKDISSKDSNACMVINSPEGENKTQVDDGRLQKLEVMGVNGIPSNVDSIMRTGMKESSYSETTKIKEPEVLRKILEGELDTKHGKNLKKIILLYPNKPKVLNREKDLSTSSDFCPENLELKDRSTADESLPKHGHKTIIEDRLECRERKSDNTNKKDHMEETRKAEKTKVTFEEKKQAKEKEGRKKNQEHNTEKPEENKERTGSEGRPRKDIKYQKEKRNVSSKVGTRKGSEEELKSDVKSICKERKGTKSKEGKRKKNKSKESIEKLEDEEGKVKLKDEKRKGIESKEEKGKVKSKKDERKIILIEEERNMKSGERKRNEMKSKGKARNMKTKDEESQVSGKVVKFKQAEALAEKQLGAETSDNCKQKTEEYERLEVEQNISSECRKMQICQLEEKKQNLDIREKYLISLKNEKMQENIAFQGLHSASEGEAERIRDMHNRERNIHSNKGNMHSNKNKVHVSEGDVHIGKRDVHSNERDIHSEREIHSSEREIYNERNVHSSERDIHSNERDVHSSEREIHSNERDVHSSERDVHSSERDVHSSERDIHSNERDIHSNERDVHSSERERYNERDVHSNERDVHSSERDIHSNNRGVYSSERDIHSSERDIHSSERDKHSNERNVHSSERDIHSSERDVHSSERDVHSSERDVHSNERDVHSSER